MLRGHIYKYIHMVRVFSKAIQQMKKKTSCLGYIWDEILPSYKDPLLKNLYWYHRKVRPFFFSPFVAHMEANRWFLASSRGVVVY